jgi:hypothetical protein
MKIGNVSRWLPAIVAMLIAVVLGTTPARADDKKCSYAPEFYELAPPLKGFQCEHMGETTGEGLHFDINRDKITSAPHAKILMQAIQEEAPAAFAAYRTLDGAYKVHEVTFTINTKVPVNAGQALYDFKSHRCYVMLTQPPTLSKTPADKAFLDDQKFVVAHELAHCVQYWAFDKKTLDTLQNASEWWVEGSADYMASIAAAEGPRVKLWTDKFDEKSSYLALTQMSYETYVFFAWLAQVNGKHAVFDLIHKLSGEGGQPGARKHRIDCRCGQTAEVRGGLSRRKDHGRARRSRRQAAAPSCLSD